MKPFLSFFDRLTKHHTKKASNNIQLLIECKYNLKLLSLIRDDLGQYDKIFFNILSRLKMEVLQEFIINVKLYDSFSTKITDILFLDDDNEYVKQDLLINLLVRIKILKIYLILKIMKWQKFFYEEKSIKFERTFTSMYGTFN